PVRPVPLEDLLRPMRGQPPFLVALDGVTDPGNLGAVLRTAEVAGATGVILPRHRAVRLTPAAIKAAAGAVEYLRIALVGGLPAAITQASEAGVWPIGLDGGGRQTINDVRVAEEPIMLVLGAEGRGLSQLVHRRCEQVVSIPQRGKVQSLNVSAAAAVALYEIRRRRDLGAAPELS
ncbi:MAG: 23S rRNA (guanosine(2251)-2'-O)-methyltransferase RlmB, partial [Actinomycetota bacterium]|nr:23S rRNA (guanosine(2251)-2'-O)-methyltransferase RlmB [Actinomycetota bacterium]